ncbi:MAG: hypothetical protein GX913_08030 [Clostridiales bacterium]|nr:hypothetical protein [Clostridiales bacterium]
MAEYAKGMISKQISVTIVNELSEEEAVPVVIIEEVTTADTVQTETTAAPETIASNVAETSKTQLTTNSTTTSVATTSTAKQTTTSKNSIPNAIIELSDGTTVEIENTDTRYVVKTFSDESYTKKDGGRYLTSELKVEFNTGEIQVLETVVTRVE